MNEKSCSIRRGSSQQHPASSDRTSELACLIEAAVLQFTERLLLKLRKFQSTEDLLRDLSLFPRVPASLTPCSASPPPCKDERSAQVLDVSNSEPNDETPPPATLDGNTTPRRRRRRRRRSQDAAHSNASQLAFEAPDNADLAVRSRFSDATLWEVFESRRTRRQKSKLSSKVHPCSLKSVPPVHHAHGLMNDSAHAQVKSSQPATQRSTRNHIKSMTEARPVLGAPSKPPPSPRIHPDWTRRPGASQQLPDLRDPQSFPPLPLSAHALGAPRKPTESAPSDIATTSQASSTPDEEDATDEPSLTSRSAGWIPQLWQKLTGRQPSGGRQPIRRYHARKVLRPEVVSSYEIRANGYICTQCGDWSTWAANLGRLGQCDWCTAPTTAVMSVWCTGTHHASIR